MKAIVIYFSRADENYAVGYVDKGNTEYVAEYIKEYTGADMFKVERKVPYAKDYSTCCDEAKNEVNNNFRPEIKEVLQSIDSYDTVFIGYPIYWGTIPMPMFTQLEKLNFEGKDVYPFATHEGSGLASSISDLKRICGGANFKSGLAIQGRNVKEDSSKTLVKEWIENN